MTGGRMIESSDGDKEVREMVIGEEAGLEAQDAAAIGAGKDFGPTVMGAMFGLCVAQYIGKGVTREELLALASGVYDGIVSRMAELARQS